jgi:hypothetical protein
MICIHNIKINVFCSILRSSPVLAHHAQQTVVQQAPRVHSQHKVEVVEVFVRDLELADHVG